MRKAFICSGGGHLSEMMCLRSLFTPDDTLLITEKNPIHSTIDISIPIHYLRYATRRQPMRYALIFFMNTIQSLFIFLRFRPHVVITTGAHTAIPFCFWAWIFRRRIIFIESIARVRSASLTGRLLQRWCHRLYVQWPEMKAVYPQAVYIGQLLPEGTDTI